MLDEKSSRDGGWGRSALALRVALQLTRSGAVLQTQTTARNRFRTIPVTNESGRADFLPGRFLF